jgi:hypothetical protein
MVFLMADPIEAHASAEEDRVGSEMLRTMSGIFLEGVR